MENAAGEMSKTKQQTNEFTIQREQRDICGCHNSFKLLRRILFKLIATKSGLLLPGEVKVLHVDG